MRRVWTQIFSSNMTYIKGHVC